MHDIGSTGGILIAIYFFTSRLAMRHDTCALVAVSLNLSQRTHPVVWSLNNLPFDCSQVLAVPKPIGKLKLISKDTDRTDLVQVTS